MTAETTQALEPSVAGMTWGWTGMHGTWATAGELLREAYRLRAGGAGMGQRP